MRFEKFPVPVAQQTAAVLALGDHAVVDAHEEQHLHAVQTGAGDIAHHHLVDGGRNHAHLDLPKAGIQNLGITLALRLLVAQKTGEALKEFLHPVIHLAVLPGQILIPPEAPGGKIRLVLLQLFLKLHGFQIGPQGLGHGSHRGVL